MQKSTYGEIKTNIDLRNLFSIIIIKHITWTSLASNILIFIYSRLTTVKTNRQGTTAKDSPASRDNYWDRMENAGNIKWLLLVGLLGIGPVIGCWQKLERDPEQQGPLSSKNVSFIKFNLVLLRLKKITLFYLFSTYQRQHLLLFCIVCHESPRCCFFLSLRISTDSRNNSLFFKLFVTNFI